MIKMLPLALFAVLSLAACGQDGPVANETVVPPENVLGDRGAAGTAAPGNSGEAEALDRAALPPANAGMRWAVNGTRAQYGPPESEAILSVECSAPELTVTRHHPASPGATGTISFTGSGHVASIPVATIATTGGLGRAEWQGKASGDNARAIARSFSRTGQVEITLGGVPSLVVPAEPMVQRLLSDCARA